MTCGYHRRVVLVIICGIAKVHNFHIWVLQCSLISFLKKKIKTIVFKTANKNMWTFVGILILNAFFFGSYHFRVVLHVIVCINEENVLRLQICVGQLVFMQN